MAISLVLISLVDRPHESHEPARNNPVHISVFDSLMELVLFDVEGLEFVPLKLDGVLNTLQHLEEGALVAAVALGRVSIGLE